MSKKPNHIDDLEQFYQSELSNLEIEPPAEVWNNISKKIAKPSKPFFKSSGFVVTTATVLFTATTLLVLMYQQDDQKAIQKFEEKHPIIRKIDSLAKPSEIAPVKADPQVKIKTIENKKKNTTKTKTVISSENKSIETTSTPTESANKTEVNNELKSTTAEPTTSEPANQEKSKPKSFYDKYSEQYKNKDTSRNLFKPRTK